MLLADASPGNREPRTQGLIFTLGVMFYLAEFSCIFLTYVIASFPRDIKSINGKRLIHVFPIRE